MSLAERHRLVPAFPVLRTPRLELRELTVADAPWYLAHFSEPEIVHGTGFPAQDGIAGALDEMDRYVIGLFERRDGIRWGLVLAGTDTVVGTAGIFRWVDEPEPGAEIGYDLAPEWWSRGLMAEAVAAIADYAFGTLGLACLEAFVLAGNDRAYRTLERAGFRHTGLLPAHGENEFGVLRDEHRYELRPPDRPENGPHDAGDAVGDRPDREES
jgi:ribosomal-protein-alanine N-acetyltransferase